MAELVDANDSKSFVARREGSSPSPGTEYAKRSFVPDSKAGGARAPRRGRKFR